MKSAPTLAANVWAAQASEACPPRIPAVVHLIFHMGLFTSSLLYVVSHVSSYMS